MTFRINGHAVSVGSISTGTLRHEDLIRSFAEEVKRLSLTRPDILFEAECWLEGPNSYHENFPDAFPDETKESAHEQSGPSIAYDLQSHLDGIAPEGFCFGTSAGDGSDFGWWEVEA